MSNETTKKMLKMYEQRRKPAGFFMSQFQSPIENFHDSESVEIDIDRGAEEVAVAVTDLSSGYNFGKKEIYTNKEFIPPLFKQAFSLDSADLINRAAGQNPYENPGYIANALKKFASGMAISENMIQRAVELQCSQVLQTGKADLKNADGDTVYEIDYKPKATHFPTASPIWSNGSSTIAKDIEDLIDVINEDGLATEGNWKLEIGADAFRTALADSDFLKLFDATKRIDRGSIVQPTDGMNGGKYHGTITIGSYAVEIWTYGGTYKDVETGTITKYLDSGKAVITAPECRLDLTWGNVPIIVPPEQRIVPFIPTRIRRTGAGGTDMITNVWTDAEGEHLFGGINARPLAIPTAIDRFGCIDSGV